MKFICEAVGRINELNRIVEHWQLNDPLIKNDNFALVLTNSRLELRKLDEPKLGAIYVDFLSGAVAHRRKYGGGKGQTIAKAVGLHKEKNLTIFDGTAGLGRDAFVFASIGSKVHLFERNPVVAALLEDGLTRAKQDSEIGIWMQEKMHLNPTSDFTEADENLLPQPDIIYLDPMYPHKEVKRSALIKKEMRVFQTLVGADLDADALLMPALEMAKKRVVVKRPDYAPFLADMKPTMSLKTKNNRFDVYVNEAL